MKAPLQSYPAALGQQQKSREGHLYLLERNAMKDLLSARGIARCQRSLSGRSLIERLQLTLGTPVTVLQPVSVTSDYGSDYTCAAPPKPV